MGTTVLGRIEFEHLVTMSKDSDGGDGPPMMGRSKGYLSKDIGPVMFWRIGEMIAHCFAMQCAQCKAS